MLIRFKNSPVYIQRFINRLLAKFRYFAYIYINNLVISNNILEKYLKHF